MVMMTRAFCVMALVLLPAWAAGQTAAEARDAANRRLTPGDLVTVESTGDRWGRGRFVAGRADALVLRGDRGDFAVPWEDIERLRRRHNGILLGALIGAAAGCVGGALLRTRLENEGVDGTSAFAGLAALGLGVGILVDAGTASDRTVYRRQPPAGGLVPAGGVAARMTIAW